MSRTRLKQWLSSSARFVITAVLLWYVFTKVDFASLGTRILDFSPALLLLVIVVLLTQTLAGAARWLVVIRTIHGPIPFGTVLQLMFVGMFFNQTLPSAIGGDALRVWYIYRNGLPLRAAFNSVLLDRIIAMAALLVFMAAGLPWLFRLIDTETIRLAVVAAIVSMATGLLVLYGVKYLPVFFSRWRLIRAVQNLSQDLHTIAATSQSMFRVLSLSLLLHGMTSLAVFVLARSLSLEISVLDCLVLVPPVILLTILPISMAGWGVRELGMISALGYAGITSADALLISLTLGVLIVLLSLPGGWIWLAKKYHAPQSAVSFSEADGGGRDTP
ncbi:MAG: lysylphosphatidylglycerol synthase transmembrane domain-containing protein [Nitrospirota bacterium]